MDHIETKFDRMDERIDAFKEKQKLETKTFRKALDNKISKKQFDLLAMRMNCIFNLCMKQLLMTDLYSRLNLLIYGFEESNAWETKEQSKAIIDDFLLDAVHINPAEIYLVDVHRLPRHPISSGGQQLTCPIIIKLPNIFEKKENNEFIA